MAGSHVRWEDLSEHIQGKLRLFQEQEERIVNLEVQLETLRLEQAHLEEELRPYHQCIKQFNTPPLSSVTNFPDLATQSPIHRCPVEILCKIFDLFLTFEHQRIRKLLLVCRSWYRIVMDTPMLWSRIQTPPSLFDNNRFHEINTAVDRETTRYFQACLDRSRDLPLDVELHLGDLPTRDEYIQIYIYDHLESIIEDFQVPEDDDLDPIVGNILPDLEWKYDYTFINLIVHNMIRWRSLTVHFDQDTGKNTLPILKQLNLQNATLSTLDLINTFWLEPELADEIYELLPDLSSVKCIKSDYLRLSSFRGSFACIEHLKMTLSSLEQIKELSSCSLLQTLDLGLDELEFDPSPLPPIPLPALREISISGLFGSVSYIRFLCPLLEKLDIHTSSIEPFERSGHGTASAFGIPIISPRRIYWKAESWNKSRIIAGLETLISLSSKTEYITLIVPKVVEVIIQLQGVETPLAIRHITVARGSAPGPADIAWFRWFKKWAKVNSCSFQDDTIA